MAYKKRFYKRRYYKRFKKGTYQRKFYKRRYKKSYRKALKRPEIHIFKEKLDLEMAGTTNQNGVLKPLTNISSVDANGYNQPDEVEFKLGDKKIEGRKIRLKYLYIKGYVDVNTTGTTEDDFNMKLYVFRRKRNLQNGVLGWGALMDRPEDSIDLNNAVNWTQDERKKVMYMYDWKNDMMNQVKKKVKLLYNKYDDGNNTIPFKIRIPLYDCVLTCDSTYNSTLGKYVAQAVPSANEMYFSALTPSVNSIVHLRYKLYYTDY